MADFRLKNQILARANSARFVFEKIAAKTGIQFPAQKLHFFIDVQRPCDSPPHTVSTVCFRSVSGSRRSTDAEHRGLWLGHRTLHPALERGRQGSLRGVMVFIWCLYVFIWYLLGFIWLLSVSGDFYPSIFGYLLQFANWKPWESDGTSAHLAHLFDDLH